MSMQYFPRGTEMVNDIQAEVNAVLDKEDAVYQTADADGHLGPHARYQLVTYWRRWWTPILRVEVMTAPLQWMRACKKAQDIISQKNCVKVYIVVKMRRYNNPGALKQSVVELMRRTQ